MAIGLLCEIIAQGGKASAKSFRQRAGYMSLVESGVLAECGIVQSVACDACDTPHDAEVIFEDGRYCIVCPEIGHVSLDRADLLGLETNPSVIVRKLAEAYGCKRRKGTPVAGPTWRIGALDSGAGDLALYFHPCLQSERDARELAVALQTEMKSPFTLILTAQGTLEIPGAEVVRLEEVAGLDAESGTIKPIADLHFLVDAPLESPGGHPNIYGAKLNEIISRRLHDGRALPGRNKEATAVLEEFRAKFPNQHSPSLPTVKRYVTEARSGS